MWLRPHHLHQRVCHAEGELTVHRDTTFLQFCVYSEITISYPHKSEGHLVTVHSTCLCRKVPCTPYNDFNKLKMEKSSRAFSARRSVFYHCVNRPYAWPCFESCGTTPSRPTGATIFRYLE